MSIPDQLLQFLRFLIYERFEAMIPQKITDDLNNIATQLGEWQDKQAQIPALQADVLTKQTDLSASQATLQTATQESSKEAQDILDAVTQLQADLAALSGNSNPPETVGGGSSPEGDPNQSNGGDTLSGGTGSASPRASTRHAPTRR